MIICRPNIVNPNVAAMEDSETDMSAGEKELDYNVEGIGWDGRNLTGDGQQIGDSMDASRQTSEAERKSVEIVDEQAAFRFENIDVKIQGGDVQIILSEDDADDIIMSSSLLRSLRYFDHAFSGNWNTGGSIKKVKDPITQEVVNIYRWSSRETRILGESYSTVYILDNGMSGIQS